MGDTVEISATANPYYQFVSWQDGNIDNPRSFVLLQDTAFTALWEQLYSVTIDVNDGVNTMEQDVYYRPAGDTLTITNPTKDKHAFVGWRVNGTLTPVDGGSFLYIFSENGITLTAVWKRVPQMVDLGLPSGIKWADINVGAEAEEDGGDMFAWGEIAPKDTFSQANYLYNKDGTYSKYNTTDNLTRLEPADDVAHVLWGGDWRMPTQAELEELKTYCDWTWETRNGVNGYKLTSKSNGASIFLSAHGYKYDVVQDPNQRAYYLSSDLYNEQVSRFWTLSIRKESYWVSPYGRWFGGSVRPVQSSKGVKLTLEANGGVNTMSDSIYIRPAGSTLDITNPTREGYKFVGWERATSQNISNFQGFTTSGTDEIIFDGDDYVDLAFDYRYTDAITVNMWAYMDDWNKFDTTANNMGARLLSCKHGGGYNITTNNKKLCVTIYEMAEKLSRKTISTNVSISSISSGWHMFTLTFDGEYARLYMDATLIGTSPIFSSGKLYYEPNTHLVIGAAVTKSSAILARAYMFFDGLMKNVSFLPNALSTEEISDLYEHEGLARFYFPDHDVTLKAVWKRVLEEVDLGLPSGTIWANINVGAESESDWGDHYAWGETTTKKRYWWEDYRDFERSSGSYIMKKYCFADGGYTKPEYVDNKGVLDPKDDVATTRWGDEWCMPAQTQWQELFQLCTRQWIDEEGKRGYELMGPNGNTLFIPAGGYYGNAVDTLKGTDVNYMPTEGWYWSKCLDERNIEAQHIRFWRTGYKDTTTYRYVGSSVRPVKKKIIATSDHIIWWVHITDSARFTSLSNTKNAGWMYVANGSSASDCYGKPVNRIRLNVAQAGSFTIGKTDGTTYTVIDTLQLVNPTAQPASAATLQIYPIKPVMLGANEHIVFGQPTDLGAFWHSGNAAGITYINSVGPNDADGKITIASNLAIDIGYLPDNTIPQ